MKTNSFGLDGRSVDRQFQRRPQLDGRSVESPTTLIFQGNTMKINENSLF